MRAAVAKQVLARVYRHADDPGALVPEVPERLGTEDELHEGVLADILGVCGRAQVGVAHAHDEVRVVAHEAIGVAVGRSSVFRHDLTSVS